MKFGTLFRLLLAMAFLLAVAAPVSADAETDKVAAAADAWANAGKAMVVTADKLYENLNDGDKANDPVIVDLRAAADFAKGRIPGSINIPFADVFKPEIMAKIPKDKQVVFVCYTGHTASMVTFAYNTMGYNTLVLKWGIMGWTKDETVASMRFGKGNDPERDYKVETTANELKGSFTLPDLKTGKGTVADILSARVVAFQATGKPVVLTADKPFENLNDGDKANDPIIIDTRKAEEYAAGHIPGAVNITVGNLFKPTTLAKLDPAKQIVIYCYTGHNSSMASFTLAAMGYNAVSLKWGIMGWTKDTKIAPMRFGVGADAEKDYKIEKPAATTLPKTGGMPALPVAVLTLSGLAAVATGLGLRRR